MTSSVAPEPEVGSSQSVHVLAEWRALQKGSLLDHMGIIWTSLSRTVVEGQLDVQPYHLAPNGFLHAATVVALADSACGVGCTLGKPPKAAGFVTLELKTNLLGTVREGVIETRARLIHGGRSTQVWDADVRRSDHVLIASFRCTQMLLYKEAVRSESISLAHRASQESSPGTVR